MSLSLIVDSGAYLSASGARQAALRASETPNPVGCSCETILKGLRENEKTKPQHPPSQRSGGKHLGWFKMTERELQFREVAAATAHREPSMDHRRRGTCQNIETMPGFELRRFDGGFRVWQPADLSVAAHQKLTDRTADHQTATSQRDDTPCRKA